MILFVGAKTTKHTTYLLGVYAEAKSELMSPDDNKYIPDISNRTCPCPFFSNWRLPCKHLREAYRENFIPLVNLAISCRWTIQSKHQVNVGRLIHHAPIAAIADLPPCEPSTSYSSTTNARKDQLMNEYNILISQMGNIIHSATPDMLERTVRQIKFAKECLLQTSAHATRAGDTVMPVSDGIQRGVLRIIKKVKRRAAPQAVFSRKRDHGYRRSHHCSKCRKKCVVGRISLWTLCAFCRLPVCFKCIGKKQTVCPTCRHFMEKSVHPTLRI